MSIQNAINSLLYFRILNKLRLTKILNYFLFLFQFFDREIKSALDLNKSRANVFFPYYNLYTHPFILKRNYGRNAPQIWTNIKSSSIVHCIQYPKSDYLGKKVIIEPNDHILVIGCALGFFKPSDHVKYCSHISDYISSSKVSRVLIGDNELINHARFYFSNDALKKFVMYPEMSCVPAVTMHSLNEKIKKISEGGIIRYLSIASSYKIKAVDLLLEAFAEAQSKGSLTLVCHDIPENMEKNIFKNKNINLIKNIPLSEKMKKQLYLNADVYINTTYIDGGTAVNNALEYGLPIISNTYHRGKALLKIKNGILINEPMKYYDPDGYGILWNSFESYLEQVHVLKKKGGYESVKKQLINAFKYYEEKPSNILKEGIKSLELAEKNSLEQSNRILRDLYKQVESE